MGILDMLSSMNAGPQSPSGIWDGMKYLLGGPNGAQQPQQQIPQAQAPYFTPPQDNFRAAQGALSMTPQEQSLYQRHLSNLYGPGGVDNPDGSRSTLFQSSGDVGGKTYNVPTVYNGQILPVNSAWDRAIASGMNQFPSYPNADTAEARYNQMHNYMDRDTAAYMQSRKRGPR